METGHADPATVSAEGLLAAAFGATAGVPGPADSAGGRVWLRAVALAGTGRFAAARLLTAGVTAGPFAAAARCLEGSMLRQSGAHRAAALPDGAALSLASSIDGQPGYGLSVALTVDATVGLAADALGTGRHALSARLLARADEHLRAAGAAGPQRSGAASSRDLPWWTVPRARLRREWVAAELAVYTGDAAAAAAAIDPLLSADPGPTVPRHHAKTLLIAGSAAMASDDPDRARELTTEAYGVATSEGLDPLRWAGAKMLVALSEVGHGEAFAREAAAVEADWIRHGAGLARL
ncbi:hypothetical protein [Tsukamurella pseudospumae]|uniref:Transcriptional regulator n=1 Tax=Tsukamurella pseudospumae TaxID=239498 RepID=A0A137ZDU1_9ACTN|nr:hypothetical protein [Tsukamurella pseudospumae]KXO96356.1 hypothetical protein AXK61_22865 [Tsukamurella pseudospumae]